MDAVERDRQAANDAIAEADYWKDRAEAAERERGEDRIDHQATVRDYVAAQERAEAAEQARDEWMAAAADNGGEADQQRERAEVAERELIALRSRVELAEENRLAAHAERRGAEVRAEAAERRRDELGRELADAMMRPSLAAVVERAEAAERALDDPTRDELVEAIIRYLERKGFTVKDPEEPAGLTTANTPVTKPKYGR